MCALDFQSLFERSPNPYMVLDRGLRYVAVNAAYLRVTASRREDLIGRHVFEAFPNDPSDPDDVARKQLQASFARVFATGEADVVPLIAYRVPRHTPAGPVVEERYWSATHTPLYDQNGEVAHVLQHTVDVTDLERLKRAASEASRDGATAEQVLTGLIDRAQLAQETNAKIETERSHLRRLFEQAPGFVCILRGPEHVFEIANPAYQQLIGHRDVIGKAVAEALPEVAGQGYFEILDRVFRTGEPFVGRAMPVTLVRTPGGPTQDAIVDFVYQPLVDPNGRVTGIFVQGHDITEEARLRAEHERLIGIVEQSYEFIGIADLSSKAQFVNDAGLRLVGLRPDQVRSTRVQDFFLPEDVPFVEEVVLPTVARTGRWEGEVCFRHFVTGAPIPVSWNVFLVKDPRTGEAVGYATVSHDLSAQKRSEAEQARLTRREREARAEADEASRRQRFLAESIPQQVWTADPEGNVEFVNGHAAEFFGRDADSLAGTGWFELVHEEDRPTAYARWLEASESATTFEVTYRLRRADGTWRWHLARALPLRNPDGRIVMWFGTNTDIHEAMQARNALAERARFEQQLIGIVSHDLRNPLSSIMLVAQTLLRRRDIDDASLRAVARIESNAERMNRMIRDLLDFTEARLGGGLRLERRPTDLHRIAEQVVDDVRLVHSTRRIEVQTHDRGDGEWDEDRIAQVLTNLLTNAVKYSPPESPVRVRSSGDRTEVLLEVHNQGEPIPPERLERIFEPMQRATSVIDKRSRSVGLGLYIVDQIVRAHGGAVQVSSTVEDGTTVTVRLPRARPSVAA